MNRTKKRPRVCPSSLQNISGTISRQTVSRQTVPCHNFCLLVLAVVLNGFASQSAVGSDETGAVGKSVEDREVANLGGPIKIVKLLWDANPASAANSLTSTIGKAVRRGHVQELRIALDPLRTQVQAVKEAGNSSDPRFVPSLAVHLILLLNEAEQATEVNRTLEGLSDADLRAMLLDVWFCVAEKEAFQYFRESILESANQHTAGLIQSAMARNRAEAARVILNSWLQLSPAARLAAVEPLTAAADTMQLLISAIQAGTVSKDLVNTNQLQKWMQSENKALRLSIESVWGKIRESNNAQRQQLVADTLRLLESGVSGSAGRGEVVFTRVCAQCHALHGKGAEVGPNITANGRGNLGQLVSNVMDPSLVIGEAFQAKTVLTVDGEVVAGLVAAEDERYLKIKVQGGKILEFDKNRDIEQVKASSKSLMPEGVELQMSQQELVDLFAFLCLLKPLGEDENELISGTPQGLVQP